MSQAHRQVPLAQIFPSSRSRSRNTRNLLKITTWAGGVNKSRWHGRSNASGPEAHSTPSAASPEYRLTRHSSDTLHSMLLKRHLASFALSSIALAGLPAAFTAHAQRGMNMHAPGNVALSPDGSTLAWTLRAHDGSTLHLTPVADPSPTTSSSPSPTPPPAATPAPSGRPTAPHSPSSAPAPPSPRTPPSPASPRSTSGPNPPATSSSSPTSPATSTSPPGRLTASPSPSSSSKTPPAPPARSTP